MFWKAVILFGLASCATARPQANAPGATLPGQHADPPLIPFAASSLGRDWVIEGTVTGAYRLDGDHVTVLVREAALQHGPRGSGWPEELTTLKACLGGTRPDGRWDIFSSTGISIYRTSWPGDHYQLHDLVFKVPIGSVDLQKSWLIFELDLQERRGNAGTPGTLGHVYIHTDRGLFAAAAPSPAATAAAPQTAVPSQTSQPDHPLADGSSWRRVGSLQGGYDQPMSFTAKGYLYVMGGERFEGEVSHWKRTDNHEVRYAKIGPQGSLGPWNQTTSLPAETWFRTSQGATAGDFAYLLSPRGVYVAPIGQDGALGAWRKTTPLPDSRLAYAIAIDGNRLYVSGREIGGHVLDEVISSTAGPDGQLSAWKRVGVLPTPRLDHAALFWRGRLYVTGGERYRHEPPPRTANNGIDARTEIEFFSDVQSAALATDGTLGPWSPTHRFAVPRAGHTMAIEQGHLLIIAGVYVDAEHTLEVGDIDAIGMVTNWNVAPAPIRYQHASATWGDDLYLVGGRGGTKVGDIVCLPRGDVLAISMAHLLKSRVPATAPVILAARADEPRQGTSQRAVWRGTPKWLVLDGMRFFWAEHTGKSTTG